jgi:P27 family predicted phage terminase small subunit
MAAPGVPGDLDSTGKALYRNLRTAMRERPPGPTQWQDSDHHLLAQACRHDMKARRIRPVVEKVEDMTSEGDRKQLTVHPLVRVLAAERKAFTEGLERLGFSPRARAAMGIEAKAQGESKFGF